MKIAVALLVIALTVIAWARPFYILCPIDGAQMTFDHQIGYDEHAVCWYSHMAYETGADGIAKQVKHQAYVNCSEN